jgi:hypothetical protein
MIEYRRGVELKAWDRLWHCSETCESYPLQNFIVRKMKPSDDELCARCRYEKL